ncbi:MAG TPA: alkaline phosphatase family protein [Thermotogales bacterium]|nr:alkaline phosphatase family protein [Thermotogales bacterium]
MDYRDVLREIRKKRMDEEFILPNYEGFSIVNLSNSILDHFGIPTFHPPIQLGELLGHGVENRRKVVLIVVDALGYVSFKRLIGKKEFKYVNRTFFPITSVFPSTTSVALVSISTASTPLEHGILGYILYLKEYGSLVNMIEFSPPGMGRDSFLKRIDPTRFLKRRTVHQILEERGIKSLVISASIFKNTGFNRMLNRGARMIPHHGLGDMMITIKKILTDLMGDVVVSAYWSLTDTVAHRKGPNSQEYEAEAFWFLKAFETEVIEGLPRGILKDTVFLITADHGQIETPQSREVWLKDGDEVIEELVLPPAGEQRMMYLYTKDVNTTVEKFISNYDGMMELIPSVKAIEMGLFGYGDEAPHSKERVGDLVLIARKDYSFNYIYTGQEKSLQGRHGSMSEKEMLVPLIIVSLE